MKDWSKYNIESHKDGRRVTHRWVMGMLNSGITCHVQTKHGVVAVRGQRGDSMYHIDFHPDPAACPKGKTPMDMEQCVTIFDDISSDKKALAVWILERINGGIDAGFTANDSVTVWRNQADREAVVLAVIGDQVLVEYEMPKGTSAMLLFKSVEGEFFDCGRSISYKTCPQKWVNAIKAADLEWIGNSQKTGYVAFPE